MSRRANTLTANDNKGTRPYFILAIFIHYFTCTKLHKCFRLSAIIDKNLELSLIANPDNISSIEVTGLMHLYKNEFEEANKMLEKIQTIDEEYANNSTLKKELEKNNK